MRLQHLLGMVLLMVFLPASLSADTIRLKSGSTLVGKVLRFDGKEFTVLLDGTQSRAMVLLADVASIDFEEGSPAAGGEKQVTREEIAVPDPGPRPPAKIENAPPPTEARDVPSPGEPAAREFNFEVPSKEVWVDSGIDLKPGQRVRITATGRVTLSAGRTAGPEGIELKDPDKLLENEATGGLIGVVGDDNDEFFFVGASRDFVAKRAGRLFLMLNEGSLDDNIGAFKVRVQLTGAGTAGSQE